MIHNILICIYLYIRYNFNKEEEENWQRRNNAPVKKKLNIAREGCLRDDFSKIIGITRLKLYILIMVIWQDHEWRIHVDDDESMIIEPLKNKPKK